MDKSSIRKDQFPITGKLVYFNHAAVGPLPETTFQSMQSHAIQQRDSGALYWRDWLVEVASLRREAARLISASPAEISILKNTSEGLSFVAEGFRWERGDNVITTDMEFPSNFVPWKRLERRGVECRMIQSRDGSFALEDAERLIDSQTKILSLSSASFHNGFAPDLVEYGELCAAHGVLFCVDAIQSVGALSIDVRRAKISFLAADGHKWMLGPEGTAIFFCAEEARERLEVLESGWTNVDRKGKFIGTPVELHSDSRRFEAGSLNTNGIYGLRSSLALINGIGIGAIESEVIGVATHLADRLESIGFAIRSPRPIASGIVAATPPPVDLRALEQKLGSPRSDLFESARSILLVHQFLELEGVVCAPREGMLRFSPHFYNDERDVDRVIDVLSQLL